MTDDAPSKAPSSTSVILLLLRLLQRKRRRVASGRFLCQTPGRRSAGGFAYIFFSWERLLKTPLDSRVVISLLLRRLEGEKLNRRPQSFDSPLNKFRVSGSIRFTSTHFEKVMTSSLSQVLCMHMLCSPWLHLFLPYSSVVDVGICSGILLSFRPEQSTTLDSQRHLGGHTGSLLQALLRRASSVPDGDGNAKKNSVNATSPRC